MKSKSCLTKIGSAKSFKLWPRKLPKIFTHNLPYGLRGICNYIQSGVDCISEVSQQLQMAMKLLCVLTKQLPKLTKQRATQVKAKPYFSMGLLVLTCQVIVAQTVCRPRSCISVRQNPSRNHPVIGFVEQVMSGKPNTFDWD